MNALRRVLEAACLETGLPLSGLTVLSSQVDPYRLDTPASHAEGKRLASEFERMHLRRRIHLRGLHYALVSSTSLKPNGRPYRNRHADWIWLGSCAAKSARWLGYVPFSMIVDERNSPPVIRERRKIGDPDPYVYAGGVHVEIPNLASLNPSVGVWDFEAEQPFHLVVYGEKTSLDDVLGPLCARRDADLYLPSGEISDSLLHQMAENGAKDGRRMIVFVLADFDPAGNQMAVSIGRKLQAFRDLFFPELEFDVIPVALTEAQVREFGLPSTPLKETEKRAAGWREKHRGLEQTEIDALATLQPAILTRIVERAMAPYHDHTLARRVFEARQAWLAEAQARLDERLDHEMLERLRADGKAKLETLRAEIEAINEAARASANILRLDLPDPVVPTPVLPSVEGLPVVSTRWSWAEQTRALIDRKRYSNGADDVA
jgi:hypothetical protein